MTGIWRLLCRWLVGDRIRTGPADGAIYRLGPDSVVVVAGRSLEIVRRRDAFSAVVYDCDSEHGFCQLRADLGPTGPRLVLIDSAGAVPLASGDVQLFLRRG
jgi:hypothetical protein